jgi:uncharacterized protein YndB with AHSA1/START domain
MSNLELSITQTIPAARKDLFEAWLSADTLKKFMCPMEGVTVPTAEADPTVGGNFLVVMKVGDKELPHRGEYKTIDRYDTLAFTWISNHTQAGSLVTITFKELSDSETELTLHHVGFPSEESRNDHKGGWTEIVSKLGRVFA